MTAPPSLDRDSHALFLDFDGTLAPLQADPATVFLTADQTALLTSLSAAMRGALAIISGRDIQDLGLRIPSDIIRIGGHGLDVAHAGQLPVRQPGVAPEALSTAFAETVSALEGVWIEPKGRVLAVHYRDNPGAAAALGASLGSAIDRHPDYTLQGGKMVFEAKPSAANKGTALKIAMKSDVFADRAPVIIGDDKTDEDAMIAATELGGFGIKVGDGDSVAQWRLHDTAAVWNWLETNA